MSRELYRAKSKRVQKLGRDGLVEQDKATGEERRVSQRTADVSFGPDRAPDQELVQRTSAKGTKRRQPPPPPEGRPTDEIEPSPAMRGADDVPVLPPPPAEDNGQSRKRRQRKRGGKFRQNMTAPTVRKQPEGGRLNFDDGSAPGLPPEPDRGRLRFEDAPAPDTGTAEDISAPPPPDDSSKNQRQRKQVQRFREDAASPVLADAQDGGQDRNHYDCAPGGAGWYI